MKKTIEKIKTKQIIDLVRFYFFSKKFKNLMKFFQGIEIRRDHESGKYIFSAYMGVYDRFNRSSKNSYIINLIREKDIKNMKSDKNFYYLKRKNIEITISNGR